MDSKENIVELNLVVVPIIGLSVVLLDGGGVVEEEVEDGVAKEAEDVVALEVRAQTYHPTHTNP